MVRFLVRCLLRLCFRVRVRGAIAAHEKLLIVSNHQSLLDGILLGAFLPVQPVWVLHSTIARHWFVRLPMRFLPHLIVDSAHPLGMKAVVGLIESGHPVLIFPEGRVTSTGSMMKIYEGPAFVAVRTGATVVPVHISGAVYSLFSRMSGEFPHKLFPRITVTVHPPCSIATPEAARSRVRHKLGAEALRRIMQEAAFASFEKTTLFPALLDVMAVFGRRRHILEDMQQQELTYGRLLKSSLALGRLVGKLTREGETVGVLMPNLGATVSLLYGMFAMRRVPAMLNYTAGPEAVHSACRTAGVRVVITSRAFLERARLAAVAAKLENLQLVYLEDLRASFGLADKLWLLGWAVWFPRKAARSANPTDPAVILFTSGSEGQPKGVALSHDALLSNVAQCRAIIEFAPRDRFLSALPLFHAFGLTIGIILPLMGGSHVFLYVSPLHYRVIPELIYDRDCTVLFASSTFLGNYAKYANPFDFHALRIVVAGAEKLNDEVRKLYAEKFGIRVLEGYGVTETAPVLAVNTPMAAKTGTVGELFPGCEYRLEPVPGIAEGGLLHVRGPNVMLGYLSEEQPGVIQPTRSLFGEGWHNTGDVATVDEAGFISILGRVRRFAKVAGEMVSLELVERIARAASPEFEHASAALAEAGRGETVLLFTEDPNLRREQLQQAARALGAPDLAAPRRVVHVDEIPALGSGKKDYVTLNRMARALKPPAQDLPASESD
jgi:acyl-[acyl-carrier-protein]-phospholipid O-acyltransferase/long-chain-fatty-acid--[acyl-carrier-protein] ligase